MYIVLTEDGEAITVEQLLQEAMQVSVDVLARLLADAWAVKDALARAEQEGRDYIARQEVIFVEDADSGQAKRGQLDEYFGPLRLLSSLDE